MADGYTTHDAVPPAPNIAVLRLNRRDAPALPLDLFGPFWSRWIADAAEGSDAPPDYTMAALLAAASALIGNARHVLARDGWSEPPVLWCAAVGDPSSGKSPAADPVMRIVSMIEDELATDHPEVRRRWETEREGARARKAKWLTEVKAAAEKGTPPPQIPEDADEPPEPMRPRVRANDVTMERLVEMLAGLPKGLLFTRDELAGWIACFDRYSGGGDRAFWIEAYGGRTYTVDRKKHPEPVHVRHLSVAIFGGIQPARLSEAMNDPDDGLLPRFLFAWPEAQARPTPLRCADLPAALPALRRLAMLPMASDERGNPCPRIVRFTPDAYAALEAFRADLRAREHAGLMAGAIGKAPGHVLRLAAVLTFLWWCSDASAPEPDRVTVAAVQAACGLLDAYLLPMAERVFGDAAATEVERDATTLARWIMRTRPAVVNTREVRSSARLPGLREAKRIRTAADYLVEEGWLFAPTPSGEAGRPRADYTMNPRVWEACR
ncbi:YfjI family protein [Elioraea rosea]|uniref:YfjI family protein n=1 Tax=Elioraea rosea TaxID=2492390 RepID=UPI0013156CCC|nr:YfjI family protein [Elioraea rosea]